MASYFSIVISLALLFMFLSPSLGKKDSKLKKICSQTSSQSTCMKFMKADSRTSGANNRRLTEIAIDLAYKKAQDTYRDLTGSVYSSYDSQFREPCCRNYKDAIRDLEQTRKIFRDGDYGQIADQVRDAADEIRDCINLFARGDIKDTKHLKKRNKELALLCNVVKVSAKYLRRNRDRDDD